MLICSTFHEQSASWADSTLENITMEQVVERLKQRAGFGAGFGDKAREVVEAYAKAFPGKKPVEIWSLVEQQPPERGGARRREVARSRRRSTSAWFGWQPPLFDGRIRAFHCVDICFWFYNTDLMLSHTGGGARPRKLSAKMAAAPRCSS